MTELKDVPVSKEQKPYVWTRCGCCFVVLKRNPRAFNCAMVIVYEDCGSPNHNRRKKGGFRNLRLDEVVQYDPLAQELLKAFGS